MSLDRDLVYRISVHGLSESASAIASFDKLLKAMADQQVALEKLVEETARKGSGGRRKKLDEEAAHNARLLKLQAELEARRVRDSVRAAEKADRDKAKAATQAAKQAAKEIAANESAVNKAQQAAVAQRLKEYAAAEKEKTRIAKAEQKAREADQRAVDRAEQSSAARRLRDYANQQREKERVQRQADRQAVRDEERRMRDRVFDNKRFYRGAIGGAFASVGEGLSDTMTMGKRLLGGGMRGVRTMVNGLGVGDTMNMQSIVQEQAKIGKLLDDVAIEARAPGFSFENGVVRDLEGNTVFNRERAGRTVRTASDRTGVGRDVLAAAIDEGSRLGSGSDIAGSIESVADETQLYGGDESAARTVAKIRTQLKTSATQFGKPLDDRAIGDYVRKLYVAGKKGNMRGADIGQFAERIISSAMAGGLDFASEADQQIQWLQFTNAVTGSPAQTATSMAAVANQIAKKESLINSLGVKTKNEDGGAISELQVVKDMLQATGGEGKAWNSVFDPAKSGRALLVLSDTYRRAEREKRGSGIGVVNDTLKQNELNTDQVREASDHDLALKLDTPAARLDRASTTIPNAFADQLAPVMEAMAKDAPGFAAAIVSVVQAIGPVIRDTLMPELVKLSEQAPAIAKGIVASTKTLGSALKWVTDMVVNHPVLSAGLAVGAGTAVHGIPRALQYGLGAAGRRVGDWFGTVTSVGGTVPRLGGKLMGGIGGAVSGVAGMLSQAGSTPVYVTGVAPGVALGAGAGNGLGAPLPPALGGGGGSVVGALALPVVIASILYNLGAFNDMIDHVVGSDPVERMRKDGASQNVIDEKERTEARYNNMSDVGRFAYNVASVVPIKEKDELGGRKLADVVLDEVMGEDAYKSKTAEKTSALDAARRTIYKHTQLTADESAWVNTGGAEGAIGPNMAAEAERRWVQGGGADPNGAIRAPTEGAAALGKATSDASTSLEKLNGAIERAATSLDELSRKGASASGNVSAIKAYAPLSDG